MQTGVYGMINQINRQQVKIWIHSKINWDEWLEGYESLQYLGKINDLAKEIITAETILKNPHPAETLEVLWHQMSPYIGRALVLKFPEPLILNEHMTLLYTLFNRFSIPCNQMTSFKKQVVLNIIPCRTCTPHGAGGV